MGQMAAVLLQTPHVLLANPKMCDKSLKWIVSAIVDEIGTKSHFISLLEPRKNVFIQFYVIMIINNYIANSKHCRIF